MKTMKDKCKLKDWEVVGRKKNISRGTYLGKICKDIWSKYKEI